MPSQSIVSDHQTLEFQSEHHLTAGKMRAARYYGKEDIQIKDDIAIPECGPGQVQISPAYVGICGTDLHEYLGGPK